MKLYSVLFSAVATSCAYAAAVPNFPFNSAGVKHAPIVEYYAELGCRKYIKDFAIPDAVDGNQSKYYGPSGTQSIMFMVTGDATNWQVCASGSCTSYPSPGECLPFGHGSYVQAWTF